MEGKLAPGGRAEALAAAIRGLGQTLFAPPSVKGWDGGKTWLNTATVIGRNNAAWRLMQEAGATGVRVNPAALLARHAANRDVTGQVAFFLDLLLQPEADKIDGRAAKLLAEYLALGKPEGLLLERRYREVLHAIARDLIESLAALPQEPEGDLRQFVQRSHLQTYANLEKLQKNIDEDAKAGQSGRRSDAPGLGRDLALVAQVINTSLGTRVFYLSVGGFATHANQAPAHEGLLGQIGSALAGFFEQLKQGNNADRVLLVTFSEFGRRVKENGSRGTDHGSGSCMLVVGPGVKGGAIGEHPKLDDLDDGDLRFQIDYRRVYATVLGGWLTCAVLGARFDPVPLLRKD